MHTPISCIGGNDPVTVRVSACAARARAATVKVTPKTKGDRRDFCSKYGTVPNQRRLRRRSHRTTRLTDSATGSAVVTLSKPDLATSRYP